MVRFWQVLMVLALGAAVAAQAGEERKEHKEAKLLELEGERGSLGGILIKRDGPWVFIRPDGRDGLVKLRPRWRGGNPKDGGGFDQDVMKAIEKIANHNRVELDWVREEGPRVVAYELVKPKGRKRTVGTVREVEWNSVHIEVDGVIHCFMPKWTGGSPKDGGGLDQDILRQIRQLKEGQRVEFNWEYDERPRLTSVEQA